MVHLPYNSSSYSSLRFRRRDLYRKVLYILNGSRDWLYSLLEPLGLPHKLSVKWSVFDFETFTASDSELVPCAVAFVLNPKVVYPNAKARTKALEYLTPLHNGFIPVPFFKPVNTSYAV